MVEVTEQAKPLAAPVKRGRGRPRKQPLSDPGLPVSAPISADDTPDQDMYSAVDDGPRDNITPYPPIPGNSSLEGILTLWGGITSVQRKFGGLYLYRDDPKLLLVLRRGRLVNENIAKYNDEDGPVSRDRLWKEHRAGSYTLRLVQRIVKPYGEIAKATFTFEGDYANEAERPILDLSRLDREHPKNVSYLRMLHLCGIIKIDGVDKEDEDEMSATEVLGSLASKAIENMSNNNNQPQPAAGDSSGGVGKELVGLLREQINQNRPPEQQGSVLDMVEALTKISKANTPAPVDLSPFMELQKQNNELIQAMMRKDVERAEALAAKAQQEADSYKASIPKPLTLREQLAELEEWDKTRKKLRGGRDAADDDEREPEESPSNAVGFWGALPAMIEKTTIALSLIANMGFNYAVIKNGGVPVNPATMQPSNEPAPPELAPEAKEQMERMNAVIQQLMQLEKPMLNHLRQPAKTGTDFGRFVLDNYGQETIDTIQQVDGGKQAILNLLQQYPPVWNEVSSSQNNMNRFLTFLDQFMTYQPVQVQ